MDRRGFLKRAVLAAGALGMDQTLGADTSSDDKQKQTALPQRSYGKNGVKLSVIGMGGIVVMRSEQKRADRAVAEAFERGVTYFDVAPSYGDAEVKLGPALRPYRQRAFLACKTGQRTAEGAAAELKRSFERLETDYFDLYQLHGITDVAKDVDTAFGKGGAMEVFKAAKKDGRVRHLGFSAHSEEAALAAMDRYEFDSVLFPVNFASMMANGFGKRVIERTQKEGITLLGLKAMARQQWSEGHPLRKKYDKCWYEPIEEVELAEVALRYTLSQPVAAILPPGDEGLFRLALDMVDKAVLPITEEQVAHLRTLTEKLNPLFAKA